MAEQSTTGSALYNVGTGVIGDFSVEARKNAMDRIKAEGVERRRKQQETEKKSELAFERLKELKTGGPRAYGDYLQQKRDGISNWLTEGFQKSDGNFFSGPDGRKNRVEFNNKIAEFNNSVAYTTQTQADLEKQQELLAQNPDSYTEESVRANEDYMSLNLDEQLRTEVPKLQLKVDPVDWEQNLVFGLPKGMFTEQDPSSSGSNRYILKEDALDAHVDGVIGTTFTEGAGDKNSDGFKKVMTALYDNDPLTIANAPSRIVDPETGSSEYLEGLKEFAKKQLRDRIVATQPSGKIRAATTTKVTEEITEEPPTRGAGGVQTFDPYTTKEGQIKQDGSLNYPESASINFDSGDNAIREIGAPVVIAADGLWQKRSFNTTLPKEGGFVMYGIPWEDFGPNYQKVMKEAGITGPTVDVLRISETQKEVLNENNEIIKPAGKKSTLIPITPAVRNSLNATSSRFNELEKAPAKGVDYSKK
tara:strand:- start:2861 stop:4288 length:1428 start_codon:yes stop_codon:yes gene_type:complete